MYGRIQLAKPYFSLVKFFLFNFVLELFYFFLTEIEKKWISLILSKLTLFFILFVGELSREKNKNKPTTITKTKRYDGMRVIRTIKKKIFSLH